MKRIAAFLLLATLLGACAPAAMPPRPDSSTGGLPRPEPTRTASLGPTRTAPSITVPVFPSATAVVHPALDDATTETQGDLTVIRIPVTDCASVTASPIVVGGYLLLPMHDRGFGCQPRGKYANSLLGYHVESGQLQRLLEGGAGEATPLHRAEENRVYWNVTFGGAVFVLDAANFVPVAKSESLQVTSDASGVSLDGLFYFGTINSPEDTCQQPVNPNCGGVFAIDSTGQVVKGIDIDDGFRSWIGAGLTTDGRSLYVGGGPQHLGASEGEYLYGCSVVKLDADLNVLASADPGDPGCHRTGAGENDEDAIAGEPVLGPDSVWVQFGHATDSRNQATLIRYDRDLVEQCRVELDGGPIQVAAYYGAATVDEDGNAYVPFTLPAGNRSTGRRAVLLRVTPQCHAATLADLPNSQANASPTLADDRYVLFATDGRLGIYTLDGALVREYALGTGAPVFAGPVIHDGVVYVLASDATLTVIRNTGLQGYGRAYWPRYRHDNSGSGRAEP